MIVALAAFGGDQKLDNLKAARRWCNRALYDIAQSMMGLFYALVGVMLVLGAVMAFALVFTTMSANVSERSVELAALRVLGMPRAQVSRLITAENPLLILVGLVPGLVMGYFAAAVAIVLFLQRPVPVRSAGAPHHLRLHRAGDPGGRLHLSMARPALRRQDRSRRVVRERAT